MFKMIVIMLAVAAAVSALPHNIVPEDVPQDEFVEVGATCNCCGKTVARPSCSITLFQHCNYGGYKISLAPGSYNMHTLISKGMKNDDLSSVQIHGSCTAHLYQHINFGGKVLTRTGNDSCFTNDFMIPVAQLQKIVVKDAATVEEDELEEDIDSAGRRLLGRRKTSWNDQISSAKVTDRDAAAHSCAAVCKAPCAAEKAAKQEAASKAAEKKSKENASKEKAAKAAEKKAKEQAAKEKSAKENAKKEVDAKEKAKKKKEAASKEAAAKAAEKKDKELKAKESTAKEKAHKAKVEKDKKEKDAKAKELKDKEAEKKNKESAAKEKKKKEAATKEKAEKKKEAASKEAAAKAAEKKAKAAEEKEKEKAAKEATEKKKEKAAKHAEMAEKVKEMDEKKKEKAAKEADQKAQEKAKKAADKQAKEAAAKEKKAKIPPPNPCNKWRVEEAANKKMTKALEKKVRFKPNKTTLTKEGKSILDGVADVLVKNQWMEVNLEGHSTSSGVYCQKLTKGRAQTSADYLKGKGCGNKINTSGKCKTFIGLKMSAKSSKNPPAGCKKAASLADALEML